MWIRHRHRCRIDITLEARRDGSPDLRVVVVHDFAFAAWERRGDSTDVTAWFRQAVEDLIEWGEDEEAHR